MTAELSHEALSKNLNSKFTVCLDDDQSFDVELIELSERKLSSMQERYSFILLGPNDKYLGQGMRHLRHPVMGELDLFLVPVGQNEKGTEYEVVFNCFIKKNDATS
jgi:hypothetical protein